MPSLRVNENIELRMLAEADADALLALNTSYPHAPPTDEGMFAPNTVDGALAFIRHAGKLFGIRVDDHLVGVLQLERKQYGQTVSIDYALAPAYRGQGIVTRSCLEVLRFIFEEWDMHRVEIWVDVVNVKSCAIPERLGFLREGVHRHLADYGNNCYGDIAVYALLKDEWSARRQP